MPKGELPGSCFGFRGFRVWECRFHGGLGFGRLGFRGFRVWEFRFQGV